MNIKKYSLMLVLVFSSNSVLGGIVFNSEIGNAIENRDFDKVKNMFLNKQASIKSSMYGNSQEPLIIGAARSPSGFLKTTPAPDSTENIIRFLIEQGAQINTIDNRGNTPLHTAVTYEEPETVKLLLELGADTSIKNRKGMTAYDLAIEIEDPVMKQKMKEVFGSHKMRHGFSNIAAKEKEGKRLK